MISILKQLVSLLAIVMVSFAIYLLTIHLLDGNYWALFQLVFYVLILTLFLIRKPAKDEVTGIKHWLVCMGGTFFPFAVAPFASQMIDPLLANISLPFMFIGMGISLTALFNLGKGFGVIGAHRDIKTHGLYRWVRHPLYLGEAFLFLAIIIQQFSLPVVLIYIAQLTCQIIRIHDEEALLSKDPEYQTYMQNVPYRLLPKVY